MAEGAVAWLEIRIAGVNPFGECEYASTANYACIDTAQTLKAAASRYAATSNSTLDGIQSCVATPGPTISPSQESTSAFIASYTSRIQ